jgi:hypothetical protein
MCTPRLNRRLWSTHVLGKWKNGQLNLDARASEFFRSPFVWRHERERENSGWSNDAAPAGVSVSGARSRATTTFKVGGLFTGGHLSDKTRQPSQG